MPVHASASANGAFASRSSRPGPGGERELGDLVAAEAAHDPFADVEPAARRPRAGHVVGEPAQLRRAAQRGDGQAGRADEAPLADLARRAPRPPAPPRASCQAIAGASGSPRPSRSTPVSAMPVTPIPRTVPSGAAASAAAAASSAASSRARGSISAPVGTFRQGVGAWPCARSAPSASTTAALQADVPTSMPSRRSVTARAPRPAAGRRSPRRRPRGGTGPPPTARGPCRRGAPAAARRPRPAARPRPR